MPAVGGTIGASHDHMRVYLGFLIFQGDISDQRQQFHLLIQFHCDFIFFCLPIEPAQLHERKRANGFEAASCKFLIDGELFKDVSNLIACIENQSKRLWLPGKFFIAHYGLSASDAKRRARVHAEVQLTISAIFPAKVFGLKGNTRWLKRRSFPRARSNRGFRPHTYSDWSWRQADFP